jgi:ABC-2 type transport system ATP-binding protein
VVIINKGKVVAVDSVENLTARAGSSVSVYVQLDSAGADPLPTLRGINGVSKVESSGTADRVGGFEVYSDDGRDVRRELASAIVNRGWGLLELRSARRSLEDVFLHLTTDETAEPVAEAADE